MANTLLLKRKTNATGSPSGSGADLAPGELAINTVDKKLFFEDSSGNIQEIKDSTTLAAEALADAVAMSVALG